MITLIAHVSVKAVNAPAFEALMADVSAKVREHEPSVIYYDVGRSVEDSETFVVIEVYRDVAAHSAHMATAWVRESLPIAARLMEGRPTVRQYVSRGSEPVRLSASR
jgi:quinol monooxygenase YgiN